MHNSPCSSGFQGALLDVARRNPAHRSHETEHTCVIGQLISSLGSEIQTSKNLKIPVFLQIGGSWPANSPFSMVHSYLNEQYSSLRHGYITHFQNTSSLIFTCIYRRVVPLCPWNNLRSFSLLGGGRGGGDGGGGEEIWDCWVWKWENWRVGELGECKSSLCEVSKKLGWSRTLSELVLTHNQTKPEPTPCLQAPWRNALPVSRESSGNLSGEEAS